jgi:hypothetical protein
VYFGAAPFGIVADAMATDQTAQPAQKRRPRPGSTAALGKGVPPGPRSRVATHPSRLVEYSPSTRQWLDFLAGLLAQTAWTEQAAADIPNITSRP